MSARRRGSMTSCSTLSGKKKPVAVSSENGGNGKAEAVAGVEAEAGRRQRMALGNVTNQKREILLDPLSPCIICSERIVQVQIVGKIHKNHPAFIIPCIGPTDLQKFPGTMRCCMKVPCAAAKGKTTSISITSSSKSTLLTTLSSKSVPGIPSKRTLSKRDEIAPQPAILEAPRSMDISPFLLDGRSICMDESMPICEFQKNSDIVFVDAKDVAGLKSSESMVSCHKHIIDSDGHTAGNICERDDSINVIVDEVVNVDHDLTDPQLCATIAGDIYNHLRSLEDARRPSADFMERVQKDINPAMRAILNDWLVEVAVEFRLIPETLYLTVSCIDRYLSGNLVNRQQLQLLGVSCMMIATKFEEICAPQAEEFCLITDNTYFKEEIVQMESVVLDFLKFQISAPTTICFLRRFVQAAQASKEASPLSLECLCHYIAELSLLDYRILRFAPSMIAASSVFLAQYILDPSRRPWNATLRHHTLYDSKDLRDCVTDLHNLRLNNDSSSFPAIRGKYSQHKYKYVAMRACPTTIPAECF